MDLFSRRAVATAEPGVANEVSDAEALVWVELKHASDEVLELLGIVALALELGL